MSLGGCGDDDGGDGDPSQQAEGIDVELDAEIQPLTDRLRIRYTVTNRGDEPVLVLNRLGRAVGGGTRYGPEEWAVLDAGEGVAEIAQRAIAPPDGVEMASMAPLGVTELAPGAATEAEVVVPLPLVARGPYTSAGQGPPDDPDQVRFCLGAATEDPSAGRTARRGEGTPADVDAIVTHSPLWTDAQAIVCSPPRSLR